MLQKRKVFFIGVLFGVLSTLALWAILLTTISSVIKLILYIVILILFLSSQLYIMNSLKNPNLGVDYSSKLFRQEIRNYRWFGVFLFGATSPFILYVLLYMAFKKM